MTTNIEYCAQHYLRQWIIDEKRLHAALNVDDPDTVISGLAEAVKFFQVARNLPRKYDIEQGQRRYEPLLQAFQELPSSSVIDSDYVAQVDRFQSRIGSSYGGRNLISLSSKLLWLRYRDPFIIYDSRVCTALKLGSANYGEFADRWMKSYKLYELNIAHVCDRLPNILRYIFSDSEVIEEKATAACSQPWFHRRVFDIFLWHEGG